MGVLSTSAEPDWVLLGLLCLLLLLLISAVIAGLYLFQTSVWARKKANRVSYKQAALCADLEALLTSQTKPAKHRVQHSSQGLLPLSQTNEKSTYSPGAKSNAQATGGPRQLTIQSGDKAEAMTSGALPLDETKSFDALQGAKHSDLSGLASGGDSSDALMHELSSHFDLSGFDFNSLYKMLDDTKYSVSSAFTRQSVDLALFYDKMSLDIEHLKHVLAVKMTVQLHKQQEGFSESVDRLVSGELLARQAFQDLMRSLETEVNRATQATATAMRNLTDDYQLWPIKDLVKSTSDCINRCVKTVQGERSRRRVFALHSEIIGRPIIDALGKSDNAEEHIVDDYLGALRIFDSHAFDLLRKLLLEESAHASAMEKLDQSQTDKRDYEMDRYHLIIVKIAKEVQVQLSYLEERLAPLNESMRESEERAHSVWVHVQGPLLENRWDELRNQPEGRLFRGINPELARVLAGLLGMRGGIKVDQETGALMPAAPFDARDPFCTIFDPGFKERLPGEEEEETDGKPQTALIELQSDEDEAEDAKSIGEKSGDEAQLSDKESLPMTEAEKAAALPANANQLADSVKDKAFAAIELRRQAIRDDLTLTDGERIHKLARLDAEQAAVEQMLAGDAAHLLSMFAQQQAQRQTLSQQLTDKNLTVDDFNLDLSQEQLDAQMAELAALEDKHLAEQKLLQKQIENEDEKDAEQFELNLEKFDAVLREAAADHASSSSAGGDSAAGGENSNQIISAIKNTSGPNSAAASLLNEYESALRGESDPDKIKLIITEAHKDKREQLKLAAIASLHQRQEADKLALTSSAGTPNRGTPGGAMTQASKIRMTQLIAQSRLEVNDTSRRQVKGGGGAGGISRFQLNQHSLMLSVLDSEARQAVDDAFDWCKLELQQSTTRHLSDEAKFEKLADWHKKQQEEAASDDAAAAGTAAGQRTPGGTLRDDLSAILEAAKSDANALDSALELEAAKQRSKLNDKLATQKALQKARNAERQAQMLKGSAASVAYQSALEQELEVIRTSIGKIPDVLQRSQLKKMSELVCRPRQESETEDLLRAHLDQRTSYMLELAHEATESGESIDPILMERRIGEKFDAEHKRDIQALEQKHAQEIRNHYKAIFEDEEFSGPEWQRSTEIASVADYQAAKRREMAGRRSSAIAAQSELEQMTQKGAALKAKLTAEEELDKMQREAEQAAQQSKRKRLAEQQAAKRLELEQLSDMSETQREDILALHRLNQNNSERAWDNERARQATQLERRLQEKKQKKALARARQNQAAQQAKEVERQVKLRMARAEKEQQTEEKVKQAEERWKLRAQQAQDQQMGIKSGTGAGGVGAAAGDFDAFADPLETEESRHARKLAAIQQQQSELADRQKVIEKLGRIETQVQQLSADAAAWRNSLYVDPLDASDPAYQPNPSLGDEIVPAPSASLSHAHLVLLRFATCLTSLLIQHRLVVIPSSAGLLLHTETRRQRLTLLIAQELPVAKYPSTMYKNSFAYDSANNTLFIRRQRLNDVGSFLLVVLHALAHLTAQAQLEQKARLNQHAGQKSTAVEANTDSAWDSRSAVFIGALQPLLQIMCSDVFFASSRRALQTPLNVTKQPSDIPALAADPSIGQAIREKTIDEMLQVDPRAHADDTASADQTAAAAAKDASAAADASSALAVAPQSGAFAGVCCSDEFAPRQLMQRLHQYKTFTHSANMYAHLCSLEKHAHQREHARLVDTETHYQERLAKSFKDNKAQNWMSMPPQPGEQIDLEAVQDIEDALNASLINSVQAINATEAKLQQTKSKLAQEQQKSKADKATKDPSAAAGPALSVPLLQEIRATQALLGQLATEKASIISRLAKVQEMQARLDGTFVQPESKTAAATQESSTQEAAAAAAPAPTVVS